MELNSSFQYPNFKDLPHQGLMERISTQIASADTVFRAGLSWVFGLGIQAEMPFYLKNNLALINRLSFISLLLALPGSFILMLAGFDHSLTLMLSGVLVCSLILALNAAHLVQWAQTAFAFSPAAVILTYTLFELSSGSLTDPLLYILARQGLVLSLLLPILLFGFEKPQRWITLGECVIVLLLFDIASVRTGNPLITTGNSQGFFAILSVVQFACLAACMLYLQTYTMDHEQQVNQSNQKLQTMAIRDGMTGLFNHTFMEQMIQDAINRSKRSRTPLSLLMIDVDYFKQVNDTQGHNAGDKVLVELAKLIESSKRSTDYFGRWGGDELVLLLTDTNLQGASLLAEKLRGRVNNHTFPNNTHLSVSLGASTYQEGDSPAGFIERADAAMYHAKHAGRNRVEVQA
jgi:diguanylate cyclase (GGDEF)-like protein